MKKIMLPLLVTFVLGFLINCDSKTDSRQTLPVKKEEKVKSKTIEDIIALPESFNPQYKIANIRDVSHSQATRKVVSVFLPKDLSKKNVEENFKHAILKIYNESKPDAITIWGYKNGDDIKETFTVGDAVFAPFGKWEQTKRSYSLGNHKIIVKVKDSYLKPPAILKVGTLITIKNYDAKNDFVKMSNSPSKWGDVNIIGEIKNGTNGKILEVKTFPAPGDFLPTTLYKIKTNKNNKEGWVFSSHVEPVKR